MAKILVIEDEIPLLESILELLEAEGFEAVGAEDGQAGIQLVSEVSPNLIICDILMPELDGYGVLTQLREDVETALIPFIFLTAKGAINDVRQGMNLGADDYLTKPFKQVDLLKAIATRLDRQATILELQTKIEQLKKTDTLKEEFLETASDKLREPITNIKIALQLLKDAPSKDLQQRYFELLKTECTREINLINDLLDLHKLECNARPLRLEPIHLQNFIPTVVEPFQHQARARQQTLHINISPYLPKLILDGADLQRIVGELLNNACKYTAPQGKIALEIYRSVIPIIPESTSFPLTSIVVSNEATLPADTIPRLFDQFYRVPGGDRWKQGGSGLGLTLIQKLINRLNGTIYVTSERGWTHVHVSLPAQVSG